MPGEALVTIGSKQWTVSVASTPAELVAGLSGIASMEANTGMLFDLGYEQIVTVSAEDMLFPLSIIFIGGNLLVTEVALLLAPGGSGTSSLPCKYFLEVNEGEAEGIVAGDAVTIELSEQPTEGIDISEIMNMMIMLVVVVMMMKMMTGVIPKE